MRTPAPEVTITSRQFRRGVRAMLRCFGVTPWPAHQADVALDASPNTFCRGDAEAACPTCSPVNYALRHAKHRAGAA